MNGNESKQNYIIAYKCYNCDHVWLDTWDSIPDGECPQCSAKNVSPQDSLCIGTVPDMDYQLSYTERSVKPEEITDSRMHDRDVDFYFKVKFNRGSRIFDIDVVYDHPIEFNRMLSDKEKQWIQHKIMKLMDVKIICMNCHQYANREDQKTRDPLRIGQSLMSLFPNSFINSRLELILVRKHNIYIRIDDIHSEEDLLCKAISYLSRPSCKGLKRKDREYCRERLNAFLGTSFTEDEMAHIYTYLGNDCNRELTKEFIKNGYDLSVLPPDTRKQ